MKVKVKICGIQTLAAAQAASDAGADFLGFNFVSASKRFISPGRAKNIIKKMPSSIARVGVFMDAELKEVNNLTDYLKLDYIQLHGDESPEYISLIQDAGIIKSFSLDADFDTEKIIKKMKKYKADYFLLDRKVQGKGKPLNLRKVMKLTSLFSVFLAGGLTYENISRALSIVKPYAVDVAGGIETDGGQDLKKIIQFIKIVKI